MTARLSWGCGALWATITPADWVCSDVDDHGQHHVGDIRGGLPWADDTFDYAHTNHALQMLGYHDLVPALRELRRVIKPGGVLRILVPDLLGAVDAYRGGVRSWFPIDAKAEPDMDGALCAYLSWWGTERSVFTVPWLVQLCGRAGFAKPGAAGSPTRLGRAAPWSACDDPAIMELDSRPHESIVVEAVK